MPLLRCFGGRGLGKSLWVLLVVEFGFSDVENGCCGWENNGGVSSSFVLVFVFVVDVFVVVVLLLIVVLVLLVSLMLLLLFISHCSRFLN